MKNLLSTLLSGDYNSFRLSQAVMSRLKEREVGLLSDCEDRESLVEGASLGDSEAAVSDAPSEADNKSAY